MKRILTTSIIRAVTFVTLILGGCSKNSSAPSPQILSAQPPSASQSAKNEDKKDALKADENNEKNNSEGKVIEPDGKPILPYPHIPLLTTSA